MPSLQRRCHAAPNALTHCHLSHSAPPPLSPFPPPFTPAALRFQSKEYLNLQKKPIDLIRALPREDNILEWHYLIEGPKDSPYAGGFYHGVLKFPADYPYKPPSILMYTPNGRFIPNQRLCLSMSDFHPESWNPMWSVSSILAGLLSFMLDTSKTYGSMESTTPQKQQYSAQSLDFNVYVVQGSTAVEKGGANGRGRGGVGWGRQEGE